MAFKFLQLREKEGVVAKLYSYWEPDFAARGRGRSYNQTFQLWETDFIAMGRGKVSSQTL